MVNLLDGKHNDRLWKETRERRLKAGKKQEPILSEPEREEIDKELTELFNQVLKKIGSY